MMLDSNANRDVYGHPSNDGAYQMWRVDVDGDGFSSFECFATQFVLDSNGERRVYTMRRNDGAFQGGGSTTCDQPQTGAGQVLLADPPRVECEVDAMSRRRRATTRLPGRCQSGTSNVIAID